MARTRPPDPLAATSLGEAAAIGRIEKALFGGDRLVQVGRYEIRELIGSGAMGKVYRARDPQLERDVALKVLTTSPDADREALLGEARMLAALGHPNVVAVHDAGVIDDDRGRIRIFIAMELVAGASLRDWLARPRPPATIVEIMRQVGRGIAAAHAAGVVHRDLKPDNILVGDDGRARVVDFGLARSKGPGSQHGEPDQGPLRRAEIDGDAAQSDEPAVVGTPAYMAPEQLDGARATTLSDQFAFCVTLWEALCGERPFRGRSIVELRAAEAEPLAKPARAVPARVARALARGLKVVPEARFRSMDELVAALEPRRARWLVPIALTATAGVGLAVGLVATQSPADDPCPLPRAQLAGIWDPPRQVAIGVAFAASHSPLQAETFPRVQAALDRATSSWLDAHRQACRATSVTHEQSPDLLDRRMSCLRDWRRQLRAVSDGLASATPAVVQGAVTAIASLPPIDRCGDADALAGAPADPVTRAHLDELLDRLAAARRLLLAGSTGAAEAIKQVDDVARDPLATQHVPLAIAVAQWRADAQVALGHYDDARTAARGAFDLAVSSSDRRAAATAATSIAALGAYDTRRKADALQWVQTGQSIVAKLERARDLEARLASAEGSVQLVNADAVAATAPLERAVASWRALDPNHPQLGGSLAMLGVAELAVGKLDAAEDHLRDGLARAEAALGAKHPDVASIEMKLALASAARGHYRDAAVASGRAIAILHQYGPDYPTLLYAFGARAQHDQMRGDRAAAERDFREAKRIAVASFGADHPMVGQISLMLADLLARAGRGNEALELAQRARATVAKTADERDLGLAYADAIVARALAATGKPQDALAKARAAVARCDAFPQGLPMGPCAIIHQALGELTPNPGEREREFEAASHAITTGASDPVRLAEIRLALATSRLGHDRPGALALAAQALREFPRDGDPQVREALAAFVR